jgi:hypothetical protein
VAVTGITGVPETVTVGVPLTLSGTVKPSNATNKTITWSVKTGNAGIANDNKLTATAAGTVTVTATISNGSISGNYTKDFDITIIPATVAVTGISLNKDKDYIIIEKGTTYTLTATVTPDDATNKTVTWSTSKSSVATVANGKVTTSSSQGGTVRIYARTQDGKYETYCDFYVRIPVTSVTISPASVTVDLNSALPHYAFYSTVLPTNTTFGSKVKWTISSRSLRSNATISDSGLVNIGSSAESGMILTVTATLGDKTGTATITIQ